MEATPKRLRLQDRILDRLRRRGPATFTDLYRLPASRAAVDEAVVQLVAAGLVRRAWGKNGVVVELVSEEVGSKE